MVYVGASIDLIDEAIATHRKIDQHGKQQLAKSDRHTYFYGSSVTVPVLGTLTSQHDDQKITRI
jgi:hypothetical protein